MPTSFRSISTRVNRYGCDPKFGCSMTAISGILQRAVRREDCEGLGADMLRIALRASRARSFLMPGDNADQANADEGTSAVLKRYSPPLVPISSFWSRLQVPEKIRNALKHAHPAGSRSRAVTQPGRGRRPLRARKRSQYSLPLDSRRRRSYQQDQPLVRPGKKQAIPRKSGGR